jgi:hypothetical protein
MTAITATKKPNRAMLQAKMVAAIAGVKKDLQNASNLSLAGTTYTPTTLATFLQSVIDAGNAADTARASWLAAAEAAATLAKSGTEVLTSLKQYVSNTFGKTSTQLTDFGFAPRKTATLSPEEKVAAAAKREATRKARGTLGPKAKLKVTGVTAAAAAAAAATGSNQPAAAPTSPAPTAAPVPAVPAPVPVASPTASPAIAPAAVSAAPPATTPPKA